uniref:Vitellogenin n=1 Tax=Knipowitschia caucasica TaxID=637954 RepID=A0AAV2JUM6_KNICA
MEISGVPVSDWSAHIGLRFTYRYNTTVSSSLHRASAGRNALAFDCLVDIDVVSKCHLMMQIRNPQIKPLPSQRDSVHSLKSIRESLERARLKFSLWGGRVTALCLQEGEQVWGINIQRAILSMLQTAVRAAPYSVKNETDVHGTCRSRYERRGSIVLKTRDLNQCHRSRREKLWPHSVAVSDETALRAEQQCVQRHGAAVMQEVNCTETVTAAMSENPGVRTQTVSSLVLLRTQPGATAPPSGFVELTDLQFEDEGSRGNMASAPEAAHRVRTLCGLSDQQLISQTLLELVFQLRELPLSQLKLLWQEASFKCQNVWQPLLDALSSCGSENCVVLLTELMKSGELEEEQSQAILASLPRTPHPTAQMIDSINALLEIPEFRLNAMLVASSLVHQLCRTSRSPCTEMSSVKSFLLVLVETLERSCDEVQHIQVKELLYALKSVGNAGVPAPSLISLLSLCALSESAPVEVRLAAVQAFRRMPCSQNRSVLLQLYTASQEDPEVRIAAYQQLLLCPSRNLFTTVRDLLRNETSSQVGSYIWSHLSSVLRSEDPFKQSLSELFPDDIISKDFDGEFLKYSSYSDHTFDSDMGITNVETSVVFSPKSFIPSSVSANLTVYFNGRASNLLQVDLRVENAEPFFKNIFGHDASESNPSQRPDKVRETKSTRRKEEDRESDKETCLSGAESYLRKAGALLFRRTTMKKKQPKCWLSIKIFGNEVSVFSCEDIYNEMNSFFLSMAELAIKLLKGQEVQLGHRAVLLTEELVLPSLSGLPLKLSVNMTSLLSVRLKGSAHYRDPSHFSLNGYIKPNARVALVARMGVDSAVGQAAVEWDAELRSALSLDGSVQLQEGQDLRVMLNTPEDAMDIISFSSYVFELIRDNREEIKGSKNRVQKTICTPKTLSKLVGWQLCSNTSHPALSLPPSGPSHFSLRLLKLDKGLHYYLLEAAYSVLTQRGSWTPTEASLHLLLATPQSSVPRDMSLDLAFSPSRVLLRFSHPQKTIILQGQMKQNKNVRSSKVEISIDGAHFYIMGLINKQTIAAEQRTNYHLEAKLSNTGGPMILSANVTRGLGRKTSVSASVKNVFRETALLSVTLERRRDSSSKQLSVEGELLLPGLLGGRMLGLMEQKASLWSSALRLKYGLGGDARHLQQECFTSQRLKSERDSNHTYIMRADHEFYCSNTAAINHKVQVRHEESPSLFQSHLDLSYGKHWDEINNKQKLILSQMFKNQSTQNHTSYTLEFSLQAPEKNLHYRTQLLHSHLMHAGSESSSHLKIHYNNLTPLVAGLHWKGSPHNAPQKKWEGTFNMDTPWVYIYTSHKLSRQQPHTLQFTSELSCRKWLSVRHLLLEALYRQRGRETEAWVHVHSPDVTYLQTGGWVLTGKKSVKASCSFKSLWTSPLGGALSLETSKFSHTLEITSSYGTHNANVTAALNSADKKLKRRQALLKMSFCELQGHPIEFMLEGEVEELKKDKKIFQKIAKLQLRQPFQVFVNSLLLQETFTVDTLKGLYVLESKATVSGNEVRHTLTIGHQPPKPFLCSTLIHPFNTIILPSESEMCLHLFTNQTQKRIYGVLRTDGKDKLSFYGQVNLKHLDSPLIGIEVNANFSHQLQLQLPSAAVVEADVCWAIKNNTGFDYKAKGKLKIERQECLVGIQLNGTSSRIDVFSSLSHPFKSKIPKVLEARAAAHIFTGSGGGRTTVRLRAEGKDKMTMDAQVFHTLQRAEKSVGLKINLHQSLLPTTKDLFMDIVSGDLSHNLRNLHFLPIAVALYGTLKKTDNLMDGLLRVKVSDAFYRVELRHQKSDAREEVLNKPGGSHPKPNSLRVAIKQQCKSGVEAGRRTNISSVLSSLSLWHQIKMLQGVVPTEMQMNCTGDVITDRFSVRCSADVAGRPVGTVLPHTSLNLSVSRSCCSAVGSILVSSRDSGSGNFTASLQWKPTLGFKTSVLQSWDVLQTLGFPGHGELTLNHSPDSPGIEVGLELGNCHIRGHLEKTLEKFTANATSYCPALQHSLLPVSLVVSTLVSGVPCRLTLSSSLWADGQDLSVDLLQSCSPSHISASLSHSFTELRRRGLPQDLTVEATMPWGPQNSGALLIKAGSCHLKASGVKQDNEKTGWMWAVESDCPSLKTHVNGSVWRDPHGIWAAFVENSLDGKRGLLHIHARVWPELHLESELSHDLPAFKHVPKRLSLRVTSLSRPQPYNVQGVLQVDDCVLEAKGETQGLHSQLLYSHNCTEKWGSPHSIHASGALVVSAAMTKSHVFLVVDDRELQATATLRNNKNKNEVTLLLNHCIPLLENMGFPLNASTTMHSENQGNNTLSYVFQSRVGTAKFHQELSVVKMFEGVRVRSSCRHTVDALRSLGVPSNSSIQVDVRSGEGKGLMLQSWVDNKNAGINLKWKCLYLVNELKASVWHSWSWLKDKGVPVITEGLMTIYGYFPQLQSKGQLRIDGHRLFSSGLNVSAASGRFTASISYVPQTLNQTPPHRLAATVAAQLKGLVRSASVDVHSHAWRMLMMGDAGGWGGTRGSKEARVTVRHTIHSRRSPVFQIEAWGRLTESQLRCSMALNPELSSSLALILQGHQLPHSKDLMLKVVQKIPRLQMYLPSHLSVQTQVNQSQAGVSSLLEVSSGRKHLWALGEVVTTKSGYRQGLELKHSYPKLKPLPRMVTIRTVYERRDWSCQVQHEALWGNQEVSLSGLYSAPPLLHMGNHTIKVHISTAPRWSNLDLNLERFPQGRTDSLSLEWMRHGQPEQLQMLSLWRRSEELNETKLELKQPFMIKHSHLSLSSVSQSSERQHRSSQKTLFMWNGAVNLSLDLNREQQYNSSRGQACVVFSSQQASLSPVKGCLSAVQEDNSYSQNAEFRWSNRSVKQGLKYQRGQRGLHSVQVNIWLDRVSPPPCLSHSLLFKLQTNLRDRLDHTLLLGICPSQPGLSWSGSHRVSSGDELFYSQSRLSLTQRPHQCSVTVALANSSSTQKTNISLFSEFRFGNWSIDVGGSVLTWSRGSGIMLQAQLDRREKLWLNSTLSGRCLQTTAGFIHGPGQSEDIRVQACTGKDHSINVNIEAKDSDNEAQPLTRVSVGTVNQKLSLKACACLESLISVESQVQYWGSQIRGKLLEKVKTLQHLLNEFRQQSRDSEFVQGVSTLPSDALRGLELLLSVKQADRGLMGQWQKSSARRFLTEDLPQFLSLLQHASLLGQQELRRPLATLAGVYQDVKGQRLEALWREAVSVWTETVGEVVPVDSPQLLPIVQLGITGLHISLEVAGQQSYQWLENRLALALSGVRKRLASVYKFSPRECSVSMSMPLPKLHWPGTNEAELVQAVLEEWLLKPLQSLASIRPTAELYRLKRKIMDSPFLYQALVVSDQFVVTFDNHIFELPRSCPLLLARGVSVDALFTLMLNPNPKSFLLIEMNNNNISIQLNGQVKVNCNTLGTNTFFGDGVSVKRTAKVIEVSNQDGVSLSCDMSTAVCSLTLDGWLHGISTGLMGTNDNEAGNDFIFPNRAYTNNHKNFLSSWKLTPECGETTVKNETFLRSAMSCTSLFSSLDSPLSSCFRVVDPSRFLSVCKRSPHRDAPCHLASSFSHVCQQNYVPLETPGQCRKV